MPIDAAAAVAAEPRSTELAWDHKDVQLYHLGIGAGLPATDPGELRYTLESALQVLPSFATVAGGTMALGGALSAPGVDVDLAAVLHGSQRIEQHRPLPADGSATSTGRITAVHDKGKAAVIVYETQAADERGPLWSSRAEVFVRGEGGFGGARGPSQRIPAPGRDPDLMLTRGTREDQALLYRLNGDWNPLHADPEFARGAGYERPILHGLCTYGIALKAVVDAVLDGDAGRVRSYTARFAGVLYPGETLSIRVWRGPHRTHLTATSCERDTPVLTDTVIEHT